jgi:anaerobic ribonucleoside-triphosphate reductase
MKPRAQGMGKARSAAPRTLVVSRQSANREHFFGNFYIHDLPYCKTHTYPLSILHRWVARYSGKSPVETA